jgi:GGDEF domain-containing protein
MSSNPNVDPLSQTIASTQTIRLAALPDPGDSGTSFEQKFERIVRLTAKLLHAPIAAITLIHHEHEWFKFVCGWEQRKIALDSSLGGIVADARELVVIPDAAEDARTQSHPLVAREPYIRFFAAIPLFERHGEVVGTLSVMDTRPHLQAEIDIDSLIDLAAIAQSDILADQLNNAQAALTNKLGVARREALIDPLTRVWNRRGSNMALKTAFAEADAGNQSITISVIDVDRFKTINDSYGHDVGDVVLRKIAETLVGNVREYDIVCRLGGDEFLLILPQADSTLAGKAV